ncbi:mannose-1-phosphate guanylyltransferase [Fulvivirga lutea]|uniref:mannose-1-phosphate guanylyltransferase n=1 Tax=Fulvivirga lutea TaxID=2810512 RepID=A0A975A1I9_9BACT|nr:mannose-1-phosphate guanylyltransferase [Fulvivirga lutea]QSE98499.1 mannose-1-phosphate guanylyltransferase [Fulvivirga lutea]
MNKHNYVVIMAGGVGSRFWPYSRTTKPKQFLDILNTGRTLIQMTYDRFKSKVPEENIYVVTHQDYGDLVKDQLPKLTSDQILLEPLRRNTAPCIAYASYKISKKDPDAIITIAPSDHLIVNEGEFHTFWEKALNAAEDQQKLITLGLKPNKPETGFGYIQFLDEKGSLKKVKTFTEKPERALAEKFIESGDFLWNSGIFIWGVQAIINAIEECLPEMSELFEEALPKLSTPDEAAVISTVYSQCTNISIDFGVMESAASVYVVPSDFTWSDLGSWNALHEHSEKDSNDNVVQANALVYDTKNTLIKGPKEKLIIVQGLQNYMVTECDNVLLICRRDNEQKFRDFVADVKKSKGKEYL